MIEVTEETQVLGAHIFVGCMPLPKQCLKPNACDYENDKRMGILKEILNDYSSHICIIGGDDKEITKLYKEMLLLCEQIDEEYLQEEEIVSLTICKKIFWFRDKRSCKIFEEVYSREKNELIIRHYERTLESVAGNNLCISFCDSRGMIDRLPMDMWLVANRDAIEWGD